MKNFEIKITTETNTTVPTNDYISIHLSVNKSIENVFIISDIETAVKEIVSDTAEAVYSEGTTATFGTLSDIHVSVIDGIISERIAEVIIQNVTSILNDSIEERFTKELRAEAEKSAKQIMEVVNTLLNTQHHSGCSATGTKLELIKLLEESMK